MKQSGVIIVYDPDLPHEIQIETFTCPHCGCVGRVTSSLPRAKKLVSELGPIAEDWGDSPNDDGGWCFKCQALICRKHGCADHDDRKHPYFARMGFGY